MGTGAAQRSRNGGVVVAGTGLLWKVGGMERSAEGLQGLVCHCQPFLNSLQNDGHFEVSQSCLNPA